MKNFLILFLMLHLSGALSAQTIPDSIARRKNIIKINPLSLLVGDVSLFYERVLTRYSSIVGGVGFGSETYEYPNNKANVPSPGRFHYERLTAEYRCYFAPIHQAPYGFYAGLYTRFSRLTLEDYQFDTQGEFIRDQQGLLVKAVSQRYVWIPGGMMGLQVAGKRLALDLFLGLQYQLPTSGPPLRSVVPELMSKETLVPRLGLTAGYRF
jgi:hypothetical protein